ncbi:hypothetical protein EHP00_1667 [Ecytonucleospora hepatopenaei]|uniref:Uncharacterized protein n=1 Tax=Ecytonucleospora hepatopenaei TaxID=646526 RepID=A0A1W0E300_9MICR|nr:hypothetical protein EHP00_1667 [Ecytonucleospora hepatopenaei]
MSKRNYKEINLPEFDYNKIFGELNESAGNQNNENIKNSSYLNSDNDNCDNNYDSSDSFMKNKSEENYKKCLQNDKNIEESYNESLPSFIKEKLTENELNAARRLSLKQEKETFVNKQGIKDKLTRINDLLDQEIEEYDELIRKFI